MSVPELTGRLAARSRSLPLIPSLSREVLVLAVCVLLLVPGILLSVAQGPVPLSVPQVWSALNGNAEGAAGPIIWNLRLPRAFLGALVGLYLALSGALLQGVLRNPLAAPNIIGVTAGAGLGASAVLVLWPAASRWVPAAAFAGAFVAALSVYAISWRRGEGTSAVRLVLGGVAVSSTLGAFTTLLMVAFSDRVQPVILWMSGSLNGRSWHHLEMMAPYGIAGLLLCLPLVRPLNLLQLGDERAGTLGLRVELVRVGVVAVACLLAGSAVSVAGLVAFVGLMVPHIMRLLIGSNHAWLLPASALGGAVLLVWADLGARLLSELPVGILTALLGGPYFIFLLYRTRAAG